MISIDARLAQNPAALFKLVTALWDSGEPEKAAALLQAASQGAETNAQIEPLLLSRGIPRYHFGMVADEERNKAYQAAIERAVRKKRGHVLDLGAGSGLLAMMAARAGAASVTACEANSALAWTAKEIVAANGLSAQLEVVSVHSSKLDREAHLNGGVDLIVTETFGHDIVGEGALESVSDALTRLARPDAQVIPARADVMVALASVERAKLDPVAGDVCGFDLSLLNRHRRRTVLLSSDAPGLVLQSEPAPLFQFDLHARVHPTSASTQLRSTGRVADGIVQWIRLQLDDQTSYENRPGSSKRSHWRWVYWPFAKSLAVAPGEELEVRGLRFDRTLMIWSPTVPD